MTSQRIKQLILDGHTPREQLCEELLKKCEQLDLARAKLLLADGLAAAAEEAIERGITERLRNALSAYSVFSIWEGTQS